MPEYSGKHYYHQSSSNWYQILLSVRARTDWKSSERFEVEKDEK